jgi:hypothetical protein
LTYAALFTLSNVETSHHKSRAGPEMALPSISQISNLNQILSPEDNQQAAELSTALVAINSHGCYYLSCQMAGFYNSCFTFRDPTLIILGIMWKID